MHLLLRYFSLTIILFLFGSSSVSADFFLTPSESATELAQKGVINYQSSISGYRLSDKITRAEMAKIVANLFNIPKNSCTGYVYLDVGPSLGDLCGLIEALASRGIINTSTTNYRPSDNVTRAEMVKMIMQSTSVNPNSSYSDVSQGLGDLYSNITYAESIGCLRSLFPGTLFYPNRDAIRGEAFQVGLCQMASLGLYEIPASDTTSTENLENLSLIDFADLRIDAASLSEYQDMLRELSVSKDEGDVLYNRSTRDTEILNAHKDLLMKLFNMGLLPTLKTFTLGNKKIFVTVGFIPGYSESLTKADYLNGDVNCDNGDMYSEYTGTCILIDQTENNILIDEALQSEEEDLQVVQGKYLLSHGAHGDICFGRASYSLFDSHLKEIASLWIEDNSCGGSIRKTIMQKGNLAITFYSDKQDEPQEPYQILSEGGNFSLLTFSKKIYGFSYNTFYLYNADSIFQFDIVKNLLNGNIFSFTINGKEKVFNPNTESTQYATDIGGIDTHHLALSMKKISGGFEISGEGENLDSIRIQSCKDNGNTYDETLYSPKSFNSETSTFTYRISEAFGNMCTLPYKFFYTLVDDDMLYSQIVTLVP